MSTGMNRRIPRQRPINPNRNANRPKYEKSIPNDGVFGNQRFTHSVTCLIGTVVQVQVKNGHIFEGVFRAFSPKMELVLECCHRVEEKTNYTPSKEQLIDKLVFKLNDIIKMEAKNVDIDYAQKDSFTDTAISGKMNMNGERPEMKELQPWDGEADDTGIDLEGSTANGWDPNDMFRTNKEKFNVDSTYDSSLTQYTTPIERRDDEDFRRREAVAAKLAHEIERSDVYKRRVDLENGDEEELYSAVHRPPVNTNKPTSPVENWPDGSVVQGRYVPPHKRPSSRGIRSGNASPVSSSHSSPQQPTNQQSVNIAEDTPRVNGDIKTENSGSVDTRSSKDALPSSIQETSQEGISSSSSSGNSTSIAPKPDTKHKEVVDSLKEFSTSFNLVEKKKPATSDIKKEESKSTEVGPSKSEDVLKDDEEPKKSLLNPNAPVFNPVGKTFQPKTTPTPPRPPSQPSPILQQPATMFVHPQYANYIIQQPMQPPSMSQKQPRMPKQITGMAMQRPEFNGQNAAAMATGQPLLAQPQTQPYTMPFMPIYTTPQSPQAYQQVLQMQGGQRMMAPQVAMVPASQSNGEHSNGQQQAMFVSQPVPAHLATHGMHPPQPAHMQAHQQRPNHTQAAQINAAGHPNPSPAHQGAGHPTSNTPQPQLVYPQQGNMGSMNPQMGQQTQGAPPLQPSPHTPASPQTVHPPSVSFPNFMGYHQAMPFNTWPQYSMAQTSVTQQQHGVTATPHSHPQQFVVMPQQAQQGGMTASQFQQAPPQIGPGGQLTAPHVQASMPGQAMIPHTGAPMASQGHPQMQYYAVPHHGSFQQHQ